MLMPLIDGDRQFDFQFGQVRVSCFYFQCRLAASRFDFVVSSIILSGAVTLNKLTSLVESDAE